jgi:type IV secretion system protein VirB10
MSDDSDAAVNDENESYEMSPDEATNLSGGKPSVLNRKKIMIIICIFFAVFICGGLILNSLKPKKNNSSSDVDLYAANSSSDFINSLQNRAANRREPEPAVIQPDEPEVKPEPEPLLPPVSFNRPYDVEPVRPAPQSPSYSQPPPSQNNQPPPTHFKSPLVPAIEGRLFSQPAQYSQPSPAVPSNRSPAEEYFSSAAAQGRSYSNPYDSRVSDYSIQNDQQNKMSFYDSSDGSSPGTGYYLGENSLWTGTIIPGVLETAINTDLPGNILARVTQNIFDSRTGRNLLIPQGTILLARYNSSVSYAQHRVQIAWDTIIRPDGFQIDLDGANGVDKSGMSGQAAKYHENWFEYLKAAGIITLFSIANAKMTESAAQYATDASAANIAEANSALVNQIGGNLVGRAMNVQPTLTVDNGTQINIMLNRTLYLPPVPAYQPSKKYILE